MLLDTDTLTLSSYLYKIGEVMTETQASIYEKEKARRSYRLYQKADCTMEGVSYCEHRHCY